MSMYHTIGVNEEVQKRLRNIGPSKYYSYNEIIKYLLYVYDEKNEEVKTIQEYYNRRGMSTLVLCKTCKHCRVLVDEKGSLVFAECELDLPNFKIARAVKCSSFYGG